MDYPQTSACLSESALAFERKNEDVFEYALKDVFMDRLKYTLKYHNCKNVIPFLAPAIH